MTNPDGPKEQQDGEWGTHPGEAVPLEKTSDAYQATSYQELPPYQTDSAYGQQYPQQAPGYPAQPGYQQPYEQAPAEYPQQYPYQQYPNLQYGQPYQQYPNAQYPNQQFAAPYGAPPPQGGYQQYPNAGYPQPGYGYPQQSGTSGLAIAALIVSCVGLFFCGIGSLAGAVLGFVANNQIKQTRQQGAGMAKAAMWIGAISLALWVIYWVVIIIVAITTGDSSSR